MERKIYFEIKEERFTLHSLTKEKAVMMSEIWARLGVNPSNLEKCYPLEFLRIVKGHLREACTLVAICTSERQKDIETTAIRLKKIPREDLAALLAILLIYYHKEIEKYGKEAAHE